MAFAVQHGAFQYVKARGGNVAGYMRRRHYFELALGGYIAVNPAGNYYRLASYFRFHNGRFTDCEGALCVKRPFEAAVYAQIHRVFKRQRALHSGINIKYLLY